MSDPQNCWEFMNCGREPGGSKVTDLGVCPAATDWMWDGLYGGVNGGRACWLIAGTLCDGQVQGTIAEKIGDCSICDFYVKVKEEQGLDK